MRNPELNVAQRLWLARLWQAARLFAMMPHWVKDYQGEKLLYVLL